MIAYSKHFIRQIKVRNISLASVNEAVSDPDNTVVEDGLTVYQKITTENNKLYLLRIFVNEHKQPPLAVTAYKTSKIDKYYSP